MPNHYVTIAIVTPGYEIPEDMPKNWCEHFKPMPEELMGIVASNPTCRFRNVETGEWWTKDCNGPPFDQRDKDKWERVPLSAVEKAELARKYGAVDWHEWNNANWGTKWGTYDHRRSELGGGCGPVALSFESAWGPPNDEILADIAQWCFDHGGKLVVFMGHDPGNGSIEELMRASKPSV